MGLEGRRLDIRVSTMPTLHGESVVMRILDRAAILLPLDQPRLRAADAGVRSSASSSCPTACCSSRGPPAPGRRRRSTRALDKINSPGKKIITIEDPVEYQLRGVNQIHVKPKIGLTFAAGPPAHRPPGPRRDHGRRDPRPRDGRDRHPGGAHRPPGVLDAAHQRRARRDHAPPGHGRRAVPRRVGAGGRAGPAPRPPRSARAAGSRTNPTRASSGRSASTASRRRRGSRAAPAATSVAARGTAAARASTSSCP